VDSASEDDLRRAAEGGDLTAITELADALLRRREYSEAEIWLDRAARLGGIGALTNLGAIVCKRDPERAERYLREAATAGGPFAMHNLGGLCKTPGISVSLCRFPDLKKIGDTPREIMNNGFSGR
jgi:TPR repeat protein